MNWFIKILLFPLSVLFGIGVSIRLWLYRHHFLGSTDFDVPVICVGNLSVGGSGKTPMIELLIQILQNKYPVGVISRGYGRKTAGFLRLSVQSKAEEAGDEPLLLKLKYPRTEIAVGEARVIAIPKLMSDAPQTKVILMDDGYQHLSVRPHVNILLTSYALPFWKDHLLPLGTLRERPAAKERANIIIVTKCPEDLSEGEMKKCIDKIRPETNQKIFFSGLRYGKPYLLFGGYRTLPLQEALILLTGIADSSQLTEHLSKTHQYIHFELGDHHFYEQIELQNIVKNYKDYKTWITTEKDAVRLIPFRNWFIENGIDLWVQPVAVEFLKKNTEDFTALIQSYLSYYYPEPVADINDAKDAE